MAYQDTIREKKKTKSIGNYCSDNTSISKQKMFSDLTAKQEHLKWKSHFHFKKLIPKAGKSQKIEEFVISKNRNTNSQPTCHNIEQNRKLTRSYIKKKQAARMRFLIIFFAVLGFIIPQVFMTNLNNVYLKNFKNSNIKLPESLSYLNSAEFNIADNVFLDTRYIDPVNSENPLMKSPELTEKMPNLTRKLKNLMASYPRLKSGVFIWDYSTGKYVSLNADKAYPAASIIKIPLLFQLYRRAEKGLIDLDDSISTEKAFLTNGSGSLQFFPVGTTLTYRRLAELMIQHSDNTASNMLLAAVGGMNELNREIKNWGFGKIYYYNWLPDLKGSNIASPSEIGEMLYNIDNPDFLSLKSRAEIVEIMGHVQNRHLLQTGLPRNAQFLHKTGDIGSMLGDAGTVILPDGRKYIIVVMVNRPWNSYTAKQFINEASEITYKSISRKNF